MKKLLFLLFALALTLTVGGQSAQAEYTPMAGDLIKTTKSSAVYIVDDNLKRHLFPNSVTFWTWYSGSWADQKIRVVTQDEFDILDSGKNVIARPGVNLLMFDNSSKSYAETPGGVLCETRSLYGDNWLTRVINIQSSFETDYVKDSSCIITSNGKLPNGTLISYIKSADIYLIDGDKKRKVSPEGFKANGFKTTSIVTNVPVAMSYTAGAAINVFDYNLGILYSLNNSRSAEITARPDLIVADIVFPVAKTVVNQSVQIKLIIKNTGGNLTSELGLRNIVFTGADWSTVSVAHASYPTVTNPLQTGQTFEVTYTGKFVAAGTKSFTAKVDQPSELVESNENNNNNQLTETIVVAAN